MLFLQLQNQTSARSSGQNVDQRYDNERMISFAMSGYAHLYLPEESMEIDAADLNAAAAGTLYRSFKCMILSDDFFGGDYPTMVHSWASPAPTLTPSFTGEAIDADIDLPVYIGQKFSDGVLWARYLFDTDAGADKDYITGNNIEVIVDISDIPIFANVDPVTFTFQVV